MAALDAMEPLFKSSYPTYEEWKPKGFAPSCKEDSTFLSYL